MLTNEEKDQIRTCVDALKAGLEGFRTRRAQLEMMAVVATVDNAYTHVPFTKYVESLMHLRVRSSCYEATAADELVS